MLFSLIIQWKSTRLASFPSASRALDTDIIDAKNHCRSKRKQNRQHYKHIRQNSYLNILEEILSLNESKNFYLRCT